MRTLEEIREDLREIRYYYSRKEVFDGNAKSIGVSAVQKKTERYNAIALTAPPQLYDLYVGLYVEGRTQEAYSEELGYSTKHIQKQNKILLLYLQKNMKAE